MAAIVGVFQTGDYDAWKQMFDSDPAGRQQAAKGHRVMRSVEDPNEVFVRVDFDSVEDAKAFRERLLSSGALDNVTVVKEPTVVEVAEGAWRPRGPQPPLQGRAVLAAEEELRAVAERLADSEDIEPQPVALAALLVWDLGSPVYSQREDTSVVEWADAVLDVDYR